MDLLILNLWESIIKYGYRTRISNLNGLKRWNQVKEIFPDYKIEWKNNTDKIYNDLINLGVVSTETSENSGLSHTEWERHHYLLQHGRIIAKNPEGSLLRLLQIGYNIGQFKAENERKPYNDKLLKYYNHNNLDNISTYIEIKIDNKVKKTINSKLDFRIIAMTNLGQLDMLKNMLRSADEVGIDMKLFDVYMTPTDKLNEAAGFDNTNFTPITMLKLQVIIKAIEEHDMILWVDNDIVFLKNPINDLLSRTEVPFLIQDDQWSACTGFFLIRKSELVLKILKDGLKLMKENKAREDQTAINKGFEMNKYNPTLLEEYLYPNGNIYFNKKIQSKEAKIIHFNYQKTSAEKIERMKQNKLWNPNDIGYKKVNIIQMN
jgi:hypothetical protein